jgi:hypothetical protein
LLIAVGLSRGDEAYPLSTLGVNDHYEDAIDHASREDTILSEIFAEVLFDEGEEIIEHPSRLVKADLYAS